MKHILLAFSGGLDTTYCAMLCKSKGWKVTAVTIQTGGFTQEDLNHIESMATNCKVDEWVCLDTTQSYYHDIIKYLVFGNVKKNNTYPLSVSSERIHQAKTLAKYAAEHDFDAIMHGSTGAGNDQIRFDSILKLYKPNIEIITPIRDGNLTRVEEIQFLVNHGISLNWEKAKYSINKGLWGTSIGGAETLVSDKTLPDHAYPSQPKKTQAEIVQLTFKSGELIGINGNKKNPVGCIQTLELIASDFAVGRGMHVGDTILGIKGKVGFEAAAPEVIYQAHAYLEKHILSKWQLQLKQQFADWYGMLLHEGNFHDPVMRDIEAFLESSQEFVTGEVSIQLAPYQVIPIGITSKYDLLSSKVATYGETNSAWNAEDAKGFTKIYGISNLIQTTVKPELL